MVGNYTRAGAAERAINALGFADHPSLQDARISRNRLSHKESGKVVYRYDVQTHFIDLDEPRDAVKASRAAAAKEKKARGLAHQSASDPGRTQPHRWIMWKHGIRSLQSTVSTSLVNSCVLEPSVQSSRGRSRANACFS